MYYIVNSKGQTVSGPHDTKARAEAAKRYCQLFLSVDKYQIKKRK